MCWKWWKFYNLASAVAMGFEQIFSFGISESQQCVKFF
jgi:hypothetical protein